MRDIHPNLIWIDLEMTGLGDEHVILEIATIVTDGLLNIVAEGPEIAIWRPEEELKNIEKWSLEHHSASGLLDRVKSSEITLDDAESQTLAFVAKWTTKGKSPLCGNSVYTDRRFLRKEMPLLDEFLHYRLIDVSTIKELAKRWYPNIGKPEKEGSHLALADIRESVEELKWYREKIFLQTDSVNTE